MNRVDMEMGMALIFFMAYTVARKRRCLLVLPPFRQNCYFIFLHPLLNETCAHFICKYLLGASLYYVNWQFRCTGAITRAQALSKRRK